MQTDRGGEYRQLNVFFQKLGLYIMYLAHMRMNRMDLLSANIMLLLTKVLLSYHKPPCP